MTTSEESSSTALLGVVRDLLRGARHSRRTVADQTGKSLPTSDRWLDQIAEILPDMRRVREGRSTWFLHDAQRHRPTKTATIGVCVAASLASVFDGSQHERNLKDARDYMLRARGETYGDLDRKFYFAPKGGEYALPEASGDLDEIVDAILGNRLLTFTYCHNDGRTEKLRVLPLTLVIFEHQFYVLAQRSDSSRYCYRFVRMAEIDAAEETFRYPAKNEYDPKNVFGSSFGIHISGDRPVERIELTLSGPWARYAKTHRWHPSQKVVDLDAGRVSLTLQVALCPEVETWVLGFGEHAVVVAPIALRESIARRLGDAAKGYHGTKPTLAKARPKAKTDAGRRTSRSRTK